jgi:hypothetical protein
VFRIEPSGGAAIDESAPELGVLRLIIAGA